MALLYGARGPQLIHGPAARAFDRQVNVFTGSQLLVALAATDVLHQNFSVVKSGPPPIGVAEPWRSMQLQLRAEWLSWR
jgi:hypothetical protein